MRHTPLHASNSTNSRKACSECSTSRYSSTGPGLSSMPTSREVLPDSVVACEFGVPFVPSASLQVGVVSWMVIAGAVLDGWCCNCRGGCGGGGVEWGASGEVG